MNRRSAALLSLAIAGASLCGCTTTPSRDATATLIARSDFPAAVRAAPEWVRAALGEITQLEADLQRAENQSR